MNYLFFTYLGTISLLILSYQDYKNNMHIDDRKNYFMYGVAIGLLSQLSIINFWWLFTLIISISVMQYLLKKWKAIGSGDIRALGWICYGLAIINLTYTISFLAFFIVITVIYSMLKHYLIRYKGPLPFMPVILISFILTAGVFGLYVS